MFDSAVSRDTCQPIMDIGRRAEMRRDCRPSRRYSQGSQIVIPGHATREPGTFAFSVMAGPSRSKNGVAYARLCPAIHVFVYVDARHKAGHDEGSESRIQRARSLNPPEISP